MKQKYAILGILLMSMFTLATTNVVQATSQGFFGKLGDVIAEDISNLGNEIDEASSDYSEGKEDGERAGVNGESKQCPRTGTAYCTGWSSGYYKGSESIKTVNENRD